mmetsp:Transcript_9625/g.22387  ORF Transcript_9625/g.22387 Transcript_9625/m.22387 type:complete len:360 (+) Transcript_9625:2787-3866(+)
MHPPRRLGRLVGGGLVEHRFRPLFIAGRQGPEEAVRDDIAHAGAKARVQRLIQKGQGLADRRVQFGTDRQQRRQRRRQRVARADEGGLEAFELLTCNRALCVRQHVVDELIGQLDAGHQHMLSAGLRGRDRQFAGRRRALAVPVRQQEVGHGLMVADEHRRLRQHQLAQRVQVLLLVVLIDPGDRGQIGHQRHVGVVAQDLGNRADPLGIAQEAHLPGGDRNILQDVAGLLGQGVGVQALVLEHLGGVAQHHGGDHRQAMRAHRGDGGHVTGQTAGAGGITGVEAQHAGRRWALLLVGGLFDLGVGGMGCWAHGWWWRMRARCCRKAWSLPLNLRVCARGHRHLPSAFRFGALARMNRL